MAEGPLGVGSPIQRNMKPGAGRLHPCCVLVDGFVNCIDESRSGIGHRGPDSDVSLLLAVIAAALLSRQTKRRSWHTTSLHNITDTFEPPVNDLGAGWRCAADLSWSEGATSMKVC